MGVRSPPCNAAKEESIWERNTLKKDTKRGRVSEQQGGEGVWGALLNAKYFE